MSGARERPRVLVSTDIGGTDPDDFQSMVHLLLYADDLDIEGLVSSPYGDGRSADILSVIDAYEADFGNLASHSERYPSPSSLRRIVKQGSIETAPPDGFAAASEGSEWIIACARRDDPRPLHVLVWGGIDDLAQALHDAPDIAGRIRVHYIGGPNKTWGVDAYDYIETHHRDVPMIESNSTYRGFFIGGEDDDLSPERFIGAHVAGRGALSDFFAPQLPTVKMGDTPTVTWLLHGEQVPDRPSWGGRFVPVWAGRKTVLHHPASASDQVEAFGVVELMFDAPTGFDTSHSAELMVDGREQGPFAPGVRVGDAVRFRWSPRDIRVMPYTVRSTHPGLDGLSGAFDAALPAARTWMTPSPDHADWWCDDLSPDLFVDGWPGAGTISRWRHDFMSDFAARLARCAAPLGSPITGDTARRSS